MPLRGVTTQRRLGSGKYTCALSRFAGALVGVGSPAAKLEVEARTVRPASRADDHGRDPDIGGGRELAVREGLHSKALHDERQHGEDGEEKAHHVLDFRSQYFLTRNSVSLKKLCLRSWSRSPFLEPFSAVKIEFPK